jgi:hypothetical protein
MMYVLAIAISIFRIQIFNNILPVLAATCCYLAHDNITRHALIIGKNSQIYSGRMALFAIWHDHGVLVITWPNFFYFAVFR